MRQLLSGEWSARQKGSNLQVRKDLLLKFSSMKNLFGRQYGGHLVLNALHVGMHMHWYRTLPNRLLSVEYEQISNLSLAYRKRKQKKKKRMDKKCRATSC
jgi:hypothetical protein